MDEAYEKKRMAFLKNIAASTDVNLQQNGLIYQIGERNWLPRKFIR